MLARFVRILILCLCFNGWYELEAQAPAPERNQLEFEGAATFANDSLFGNSFDRHLFLLGVSYERRLLAGRAVSVSFTSEAIPFAALLEPVVNGCALDFSGRCVFRF